MEEARDMCKVPNSLETSFSIRIKSGKDIIHGVRERIDGEPDERYKWGKSRKKK
jgi:hypothetical protein